MGDEKPKNSRAAFAEAVEKAESQVEEQFSSDEDSETDSSSEQPSAPDEKKENVEEEEQPAEEEADEKAATETEEEAEKPEDDSPGDEVDAEDKGPIPYDRFKEVVEQRNEFREDFRSLQNQLNYYLNDPDGRDEIVKFFKEEGFLEGDAAVSADGADLLGDSDDDIQDHLDALRDVLPAQAVEDLEEYLQKKIGAVDQKLEKKERQETKQQRASELQNRMKSMKEDDSYEFFEDLATEPAEGEKMTWLEKVVDENPGYWTDETGMVKPDLLEDIYQVAMVKSGKIEEKIKRAEEKGVKNFQKELEKDKEEQPMEPTNSTDSIAQKAPEKPSLRESMELAAKETNFA